MPSAGLVYLWSERTEMKLRILTGDRPTGALHLGHYVGSIQNRVALQDSYECFFIVADLHMLTTRPGVADIHAISDHTYEMLADYIGCGIDPEKSTIYLQSAIPEVYRLQLLFSMLVSVPRLQRIPSIKDMAQAVHLNEIPYGLLGYPVLQSADILLPRAHLVPIGKDNESHIEITREIARRFNKLYEEVFPIPKALISDVPVLVGTDNKAKMSKSLGNSILLSESEESLKKKVARMYTDPKRIRADIPGTVERNPVFIYHDVFNPNKEEVEDLKSRYRQGTVSDREVKDTLFNALNQFLAPIRKKRVELMKNKEYLKEILVHGTRRMQEEASITLDMVGEAMGYHHTWNELGMW